jgi:hypothetical protein
MNLKSTTFGLLAAAALSLSMFGGAIAQSTDSEDVSTVLSNAGPICSVDINTAAGGFGTWQHNGNGFVETSGVSTQTFLTNIINPSNGLCDLTIAFGGLTGPGGTIGTENFSAWSLTSPGVLNPAGHTVANVGSTWDFGYTLNFVPSTMTAGKYIGSISATVVNGV